MMGAYLTKHVCSRFTLVIHTLNRVYGSIDKNGGKQQLELFLLDRGRDGGKSGIWGALVDTIVRFGLKAQYRIDDDDDEVC